jgi:hypothetical protein
LRYMRGNNQEGLPDQDGGVPPLPSPPHYIGINPTMAHFITETTRHFVEEITRIPPLVEQVEQLDCSFKDFCEHRYPSFNGSRGPMVAESWIIDVQELLEAIVCTDEQKAMYAGLKLTSEALRWWKSKKQLLALALGGEAVITWTLFEEFDERFFR